MTRIEKLVRGCAAVILCVMMFITFFDVLGRQIFGRPVDGATEMTEICLMLITFLMLPFVALREKHIRVDLLEGFYGRLLFALQSLTGNILGAGIFALLSYRLWIVGSRSISYGDITPSLEIPVGYLFWTMSALSALTALAFLGAAILRLTRKHPEDGALKGGQGL